MLERKQEEIDRSLLDIESSIDTDIAAGLLDLNATGEKLLRSMTPEEKTDYQKLPADARTKRIQAHLIKQRREHLEAWRTRLRADTAMDAMRKV